jgi:hypothetical protein
LHGIILTQRRQRAKEIGAEVPNGCRELATPAAFFQLEEPFDLKAQYNEDLLANE